jgi:hypothetical protein
MLDAAVVVNAIVGFAEVVVFVALEVATNGIVPVIVQHVAHLPVADAPWMVTVCVPWGIGLPVRV